MQVTSRAKSGTLGGFPTGERFLPRHILHDITPTTFPRLLVRTLQQDRVDTRGIPPRPMTASRLLRSIRPALRAPLFLIGAPRSGTTFLGGSLSALPTVSYHHEPIATKFASRFVYQERWSERGARRYYRFVYRTLLRAHCNGDLTFVEKTPRNSFLVAFLHRSFPDARFLHIIRDGRDAALSYSKKPWLQAAMAGSGRVSPGGYPNGPTPRFWVEPERRGEFETTTDIHRCVWAWRRHTESALASGCSLPAHLYHELRYEDLVREPAREGRRILDFLGLSGHDAARERFLAAVGKADPSSIGGWRRELDEAAVRQMENEAGELLAKLGYL